jgi:hypothetical protein
VGLSGFLYVAIVVGWAVYLVPFALKRYDEATRNRSIDRFSSAMRVLGRYEVDDAEAAAVTRPRATATPRARAAARTAARRRRRVLLFLVLSAALVTGLAAAALTPWWSVAVPGLLVLLWLMTCRRQARREDGVRPVRVAQTAPATGDEWASPDVAPAEEWPAGGRSTHPGEVAGHELEQDEVDLAPQAGAPADDEPTVVLSQDGVDDGRAEPVGSGSLWDPVPVTLPTYVHKPRAPRTIRTIDLGSSGVQSSGRKLEESAIYTHHVDPSSMHERDDRDAEPGEPTEDHKPTRRAVGE